MLILLSPAKTLDLSLKMDNIKPSEATFKEETRELVSILEKYSKEEIGKLMKMSDKLSEINYERYQTFYNDQTNEYIALLAFKGEAYKGIKVEDFLVEDLDYAQKVLRILSGLYGVIKPLDKIKEYRLEMGTNLKNSIGKDLYQFWKEKITNMIVDNLESSPGEKVLINLASNEYSTSLNMDIIKLKSKVVQIAFFENKNGQYKLVGTYAKKARGVMARYIIKNKVDTLEGIKGFTQCGYSYSENFSNDEKIVFIR